MVECLGCGKELASDDNFCSNCGLRTERGEKMDFRTPLYRRSQWERDIDKALSTAMNSLEDALTTAKKSLQSVAETMGSEYENLKTRKTSPSDEYFFCPWCGQKNSDDAEYCVNCGKDLGK